MKLSHRHTQKNFKNLWELEVHIVVVVVVASKKETHEIIEIIKLTDWKACVILFLYFHSSLSSQCTHIHTYTVTQFEAERVRYKLNKITILWTHLLDKIDYHAVTKFFFLCFDFPSLDFAACLFWWLGKIPL